MQIDTAGAVPAQPGFDALRAGLAAAQAATPTAQASGCARLATDPAEALIRLFGDGAAAGPDGRALRGSFHPDLAGDRDERGR